MTRHEKARHKRHFILVPLGTAGDSNPFFWMSQLLRKRGHEVTLLLAATFEKPLSAPNSPPPSPNNQPELEAILKNPRLWHPWHGVRILFTFAGTWTERVFSLIQACQRPDMDNVLLAPGTAFGARLAREKLGLPLGTVHLQPCAIPSAHRSPAMRRGYQWMSGIYWTWQRCFPTMPTPIDFYAGPGVRHACQTHAIHPPKNILNQWWHSPDGVLCLFPSWFAEPQPDWPTPWVQTGFPLYDSHRQRAPLPDDLQKFLSTGSPPVLFTLGSAMKHPGTFFQTAMQVCTRLKRRGIFVSASHSPIPQPLPHHIFSCQQYVPFSELFPKVAAVVHHGGIGTLSQALLAGIPQLLMPLAFDQPDNATRLVALGVAQRIDPSQFTAKKVSERLHFLLSSSSVSSACTTFAQQIPAEDTSTQTLAFLENLDFRS